MKTVTEIQILPVKPNDRLVAFCSITQEEYDNMRKKWIKERDGYQKKLNRIYTADNEYYITASYLLELASKSYELFMGSEAEQKRQIIALTLQNLVIKDGKLTFNLQKPFDSIFVAKQSHIWGG